MSQQLVSDGPATDFLSHCGIDELRRVVPAEPQGIDGPIVAEQQAELRSSFGAQVGREVLFGARAPQRLKRCWPATHLTRGAEETIPPARVFLHAVNGTQPTPVCLGDRTVGVVYEDACARYCLLGDLRPQDTGWPRRKQAEKTFDLMEAALGQAGMDFSNVIRTWFYNDRILEWYDVFNEVRSAFFKKRGVFDRLVPASTGVGVGNTSGSALVAEALAIVPKESGIDIQAVPSPLQCPALEYGSSFSRAVEVATPGYKRLLISGTASIAPGGENLHIGDAAAQATCTMRVVQAILESRGMGWSDVCQAVAYVKRARDIGTMGDLTRKYVQGAPLAVVHADICRDELLYELELDAVRIL